LWYKIKKSILVSIKYIFRFISLLIPRKYRLRLLSEISEQLTPTYKVSTNYGEISFFSYGYLPFWRAKTFFDKEPEIIKWINNFKKSDIFWDIGANVGIYSIYAGKKGVNVKAFEPSAFNFFLLNKNIHLNSLNNNIIAYPIALSRYSSVGMLNMSNVEIGGAESKFDTKELKSVLDSNSREIKKVYSQGVFSLSIDSLVEKNNFKVPNFIKVDVDNIEVEIMLGAEKTLSNPELKGLYIELFEDDKDTNNLILFLKKNGFELISKNGHDVSNNNSLNFIFSRVE